MIRRLHNTRTSHWGVHLAWIVLGFALAFGTWPHGARAQADEAEWQLQVANMHRLYAVDVTLTFDPATVEVVDADPERDGVQIVTGPLLVGKPHFVVYNRVTIDEEENAGTVEFVVSLLNPAEPIDGGGTVATVRYRVRESSAAPDDPPFTIQAAHLATRDGRPMTVEWEENVIRQVFKVYLPALARTAEASAANSRPALDRDRIWRRPVPGVAAPTRGKWIDVDVSRQRLVAYEGDSAVFDTTVSTGKASTPTVLGRFAIGSKSTSRRMTGPGYDLPNVPWVMYFHGSFAIHGTYWHNDFGTPASHGCVNVRIPDAQWLFNWAPAGTPVVVHR